MFYWKQKVNPINTGNHKDEHLFLKMCTKCHNWKEKDNSTKKKKTTKADRKTPAKEKDVDLDQKENNDDLRSDSSIE